MARFTSDEKTVINEGVSRRSFLKSTAAVAGLALATSACVPAGPEAAGGMAAPSEEPVNIQIWWRINPTTEGVMQVFQEQHPDITVSLGDLGEAVYGTPKYVTAVAAGKGPDVSYQNRHTFRQFASRNLYRPIEDLLERDNLDKGNFMAGPIADLTWQGTLYGLPHTAGTRYFFWNRTHFEEAGLDPDVGPETWDDIMEMAPQLNKVEGDRIVRYGFLPHFPPGLSDQLLIWAMENGGVSQSEDGRTNMLNTEPWVEALEWCVNVIDEFGGGNAAASSFMEGFAGQPVDPFAQGQVSMCSYGNWMIGRYAKFPDLDYDGTGLMPVSAAQEGAQVNWSCGWTFVIDPNTELVEPGWEFLKWVISEEVRSRRRHRRPRIGEGRVGASATARRADLRPHSPRLPAGHAVHAGRVLLRPARTPEEHDGEIPRLRDLRRGLRPDRRPRRGRTVDWFQERLGIRSHQEADAARGA